jgi:hypothetical protein
MSLCFFSVAMAQSSFYLTANFDDLNEGSLGSSFSDGGIRFSNLDERIPGPSGDAFTIQTTTANLPRFSPPNYLTFGGFVPGDTTNFSFGRFGSANIDFPGMGSFASMNLIAFGTSSTNTLTLEGFLGGNVVASDTITFNGAGWDVVGRTISISGMFDSKRLVAAGPDNNGTDFFGVDNVFITIVPEPPVNSFVCYALAVVILRHFGFRARRNQKAQQ